MRIPKHIGIIPDGNRRWARRAGLPKQDGYAHGVEPGLKLLRLARDMGVQELTFYGFTTDNCGRPPEQVQAFSRACVQAVEQIASEPVSLLVTGNRDAPAFPQALLPYTTRRDLNGGGIRVNFLVRLGVGPGPPEQPRRPPRNHLRPAQLSGYLPGGSGDPLGWDAASVRLSAGAVGLRGFLRGGPALARFSAGGFLPGPSMVPKAGCDPRRIAASSLGASYCRTRRMFSWIFPDRSEYRSSSSRLKPAKRAWS